MERVKKELQNLAKKGAELGLKYAEHKETPYLLVPLFENFDIAATFKSLDKGMILSACIKKGDEIEGVYGKSTCRHSVIDYEEAYGTTGKKLGEQKVKLSGLDDLGAFLMSWHAWKQFGNRYGEVFDPQIITQLIDKVPVEKRPAAAMRWFEEKTFNDLEEILKWAVPDEEFYKSRRGQALHVLGRMVSREEVVDYIPVHFLEMVKEKFGKYFPLFLDLLKNDDEGVKKGCARALRGMSSVTVPYLIEGLEDENPDVRRGCAYTLGIMTGRRDIPVLIKHLKGKGKNWPLRHLCANTLIEIGEKCADPRLGEALKGLARDGKASLQRSGRDVRVIGKEEKVRTNGRD